MNCNSEILELVSRASPAPSACVLYLSKVFVIFWIFAGFGGVLGCQKHGCVMPVSLSEDECRR